MYISQIELKHFRGIKELVLPLDDLCVLIGENNSGKTTILDAVRICLTSPLSGDTPIFEDYDYHFPTPDSEPSTAEPIEIILTFSEKKQGEWSDKTKDSLIRAVHVDQRNFRIVTLRLQSSFDDASNRFVSKYDFLDEFGETIAESESLLTEFRSFTPIFHLASLRDAAHEFHAQSQFWSPFVRSLNISDDDKADLERVLSELNSNVVQRHSTFHSVQHYLNEMAECLPLGEKNPVSIEAISPKVFDILSRTQIKITSKTGAGIPIVRHGHGTQSLAVIYLYAAFLNSHLKDAYGDDSQPLLTLEEPEAHLHPSATGSVVKLLREISGQKLISTHSGDLLARVPLNNIRRLRRKNGNIAVYQITESDFTLGDLEKLNHKIRWTHGALLYSRCWLLVEGKTESILLTECARALNYDLHSYGVSLLEFAHIGVDKLIRFADQLGIEWYILVDNDRQGIQYERSAQRCLDTRKESDHICRLNHGNMEVFLCMEGFGDIYLDTVSDQKKSDITADNGTLEYWQQVVAAQKRVSKSINSGAVAQKIVSEGSSVVPQLIKDVIQKSHKLASQAA